MEVLEDRADAGRRLAIALESLRGESPIILGIPRGGVAVAAEIATALSAPLSVLVTRKLGVPGHEEYGFGAIGEEGVRVIDDAIVTAARLTPAAIEAVEARESKELARRVALYRGDRPAPDLANLTAVLVDDGVATGGTMLSAIAVARHFGARRVVVAVGVAPADTIAALSTEADEVFAALIPRRMRAVGAYFTDFSQLTDEDVRRLLGC